MGLGASKKIRVSDKELRRHKEIETLLMEEKLKRANLFKLLLLGPGDAGKSTIVKQMKILHKDGFELQELIRNRSIIGGNILRSICAISNAMAQLGIDFQNPELMEDVERILKYEKGTWNDDEMRPMSEPIWFSLKRIWADEGIQQCFLRSNEYQLSDSTKYFCDDMDRISGQEYTPTNDDMLRTRVSTIGIVEIEFQLRGIDLRIIDVGGQRSQRRKWIHCFENVNALIYIAAVSEYNQVLSEDYKTNRLQEAVSLFGTVINNAWFIKTAVVLFLNKKDIFEVKIMTFPLTLAFPDYTGTSNYEEAMAFVQEKFENQRGAQRNIYTHKTCATDTKQVSLVMEACFDTILTKNMSKDGMY